MLLLETEKQRIVGSWSQADPLRVSIPCEMRISLSIQTCWIPPPACTGLDFASVWHDVLSHTMSQNTRPSWLAWSLLSQRQGMVEGGLAFTCGCGSIYQSA